MRKNKEFIAVTFIYLTFILSLTILNYFNEKASQIIMYILGFLYVMGISENIKNWLFKK